MWDDFIFSLKTVSFMAGWLRAEASQLIENVIAHTLERVRSTLYPSGEVKCVSVWVAMKRSSDDANQLNRRQTTFFSAEVLIELEKLRLFIIESCCEKVAR